MIRKILALFLIWRIWLFFLAFVGTFIIKNFGNRFPYKDEVLALTNLPSWIWGFGNFDGVHYLRIAQNGYGDQYTQAFFPLYPIFINRLTYLLSYFFVNPSFFIDGLFLSNLFLVLGLYFFYKLLTIDYSHQIAFKSLIFLLFFPTSFYFGSVYSEALFFLLVTLSLLLSRKKFFISASVIAAFACATRILGILLVLVILIEIYQEIKEEKNKKLALKYLLALIIAPAGLIIYMLFLNLNYNDPLFFLTAQPFFGADRSSIPLILLPQVIFRYFKIFFDLSPISYSFLTALNELVFTLISLTVLVLAYKKVRISYWLFTLGCILIPTLTGTFSSMPRYSLMAFLLIPFIIKKIKNYYVPLLVIMAMLEIVLTVLFTRGYWVA